MPESLRKGLLRALLVSAVGVCLCGASLADGAWTSCEDDAGLIAATPETFQAHVADGFTRMVEIRAPNGKPIRVFAQDRLREVQILRAVNVLRFFLADVPGSRYGDDKTAVADAMADNGAVLLLANGIDRRVPEPGVEGQPLYENEIAVEGSVWYQKDDFGHRDATFEEIFHLVHDFGIGTFVPGALPQYQQELHAGALRALEAGLWGRPVLDRVPAWLEELAEEGSLAQEYIAAVIDSYYGLWASWDWQAGGMWGIYAAKTRPDVEALDPRGLELLEAFLPAWLGYEARLDPRFGGSFSMTFDLSRPYTHKSRYLLNATLTGTESSDLIGNDQNNVLRGNAGDNRLDGKQGIDTVVYCGERSSYRIEAADSGIVVAGDGADLLIDIERVRFADGEWAMDELLGAEQ